jgi:hypothetical protein
MGENRSAAVVEAIRLKYRKERIPNNSVKQASRKLVRLQRIMVRLRSPEVTGVTPALLILSQMPM